MFKNETGEPTAPGQHDSEVLRSRSGSFVHDTLSTVSADGEIRFLQDFQKRFGDLKPAPAAVCYSLGSQPMKNIIDHHVMTVHLHQGHHHLHHHHQS